MTKLRQLWLLTAIGSLAVLAAGYFLLVSPQANKAASLRAAAASQQNVNDGVRAQIAMLKKQAKDLPARQAELASFAAKIPNNPALPALVRGLSDAADNSGVELVSVAPSAPTLMAPTTGAVSQGGTALAAIPVLVQVTGNYSQISQFFSEIEGLPRAFLVSGAAIAPGASGPAAPAASGATGAAATTVDGSSLTATLNGHLFMTTKATAAARPVAPAAAK